MIAATCRRCGSTKLQRNGHTPSGQQKFHCKDCNFYGTLDTKDGGRAQQRQLVDNLYQERLSQPAIGRITGMTRNTVSVVVKKSPDTLSRHDCPIAQAPDPGAR